MTKTRYQLLCALVLLATLAFTLAVYTRLPAQVPTHWNASGAVDAYGPRAFVFLHTGLMIGFMLLWAVLPSLSPVRYKLEPFMDTFRFIGFALVGMLGYIQCVMVWGALSPQIDMSRAMLGGLLVFMALIGNVMGKVKPNFWIGIRTPWTIADERVWYGTHRLAGKTMVGGSLLALVVLLVGLPLQLAFGLFIAGAIVPAVYSLVLYKRLDHPVS